MDLFSYRRLMFSIAYQMTGSVGDAEDIVQEAFLRASGHQPQNPRAFLATVTTRLAIDHLRSARVRREAYVGTWLPEPILDDEVGPAGQAELSDSLSMAFLVLLESLTPAERAVFLLREVFGYQEIAEATGKSQANCPRPPPLPPSRPARSGRSRSASPGSRRPGPRPTSWSAGSATPPLATSTSPTGVSRRSTRW